MKSQQIFMYIAIQRVICTVCLFSFKCDWFKTYTNVKAEHKHPFTSLLSRHKMDSKRKNLNHILRAVAEQ